MLGDVVRSGLLFLTFVALASACSAGRSGLGNGSTHGEDAGGLDAGGLDLGGGGHDGGTGVDAPPPLDLGSDLGRIDAGCTPGACPSGLVCNPASGACEVPPDAGCATNGCSSTTLCRGDGTCTTCDPTADG